MSAADEVKKLMQYQPPLWSRLLGLVNRHHLLKVTPHRIATVTIWMRRAGKVYRGWYLLYEAPDGTRSVDYRQQEDLKFKFDPQNHYTYIHVIHPWQEGIISNAAAREAAQITSSIPTQWGVM